MRVQKFAEYKAFMRGLETILVNLRNASRQSPNGRQLKFIDYKTVELGGFITSRDVIASWNIALRGLGELKGEQVKEKGRERRTRDFRVTWSPDSLASEKVRARLNVRSPKAIKLANDCSKTVQS
jgi:transposase